MRSFNRIIKGIDLEDLFMQYAPNLWDEVSENEMMDLEDLQSLDEYLRERVDEVEVIYYSRAMEYLQENDPSLSQSLELAYMFDYDLRDLNSEHLATLLKRCNLGIEASNLIDELEDILH